MQNCKFYIGKLNLHLIIFDPSVWSFSMHPPMWPQDLGRNVPGGFWKYWFSIYFAPLSALTQSAKICWSWLPQYFLLKRWPNGEVNEIRTRSERDPMIPKYKMLKDILLEELLHSKIARASLPRISACTCLKMNVMVKYRNKMKKSCSAYAFHKRIIQKLVDNRYAQKCCSAYAFSQKARLNQIPNQHANISKSCNEARLSPLPVPFHPIKKPMGFWTHLIGAIWGDMSPVLGTNQKLQKLRVANLRWDKITTIKNPKWWKMVMNPMVESQTSP